MNQDARYRHELKCDIDYSAYLALRSRIRAIMKPDEHVGESGKYLIRSIYFDNYRDKALREKIDGAAQREKFRIRWYNDSLSFIVLEKKMKVESMTMKIDAAWSEPELRKFISGDYSFMLSHADELTLLTFANRKINSKPYIIVIACQNEKSEKSVLASLDKEVEKYVVKAQTVNRDNII